MFARKTGCESVQRGDEPEVVQGLRPQLPRDAAYVVEAVPGGFERLAERIPQGIRRGLRQPRELQHYRGEGLSDLVVEFLGDPLALGLQPLECVGTAVATLSFEPFEHLVEDRTKLLQSGCGRCVAGLTLRTWRARTIGAGRLPSIATWSRSTSGTEDEARQAVRGAASPSRARARRFGARVQRFAGDG